MSIIHLITPTVTRGRRDLNELAHLGTPDLVLRQSSLDRGPPSIESERDVSMAVPDTIRKVLDAESDGADAVVIDCMGDPGLKAARDAARIPILGPAETSMHLAAMLGRTFTVVTVVDAVKPLLRDLARTYGVSDKLASVRAVGVPVLETRTRADELRTLLADAAVAAVEQDDADVVVMGCTGFLGFATAVQQRLQVAGHDIPVIDPIPVTVCAAEALVKAGLRHSKRSYADPPSKTMIGCDNGADGIGLL